MSAGPHHAIPCHRKADEAALSRCVGEILLNDPWRRDVLATLRDVAPSAWICGGFVRNRIWDVVTFRVADSPLEDVDVIWFDPDDTSERAEARLARRLAQRSPTVPWSTHNQARMHERSGDAPYRSLAEAVSCFPDTASAVAVRLLPRGVVDVIAPHGLSDAFAAIVKPTPLASSDPERFTRFLDRKAALWNRYWPEVRIMRIASDT